jgi:Protein of unknown function (DUF1592)/Protein of unknown function (DUF1588)/Protein of unknown function (DUF1595)/Protein of unknown function (DUF1587)
MKRKSWRVAFFAAAALGAGCTGTVGNVHTAGSGGSPPTPGTGGSQVVTGTGGAGNAVATGTGGSSVVITGAAGGGVSFCTTSGIAVTSQVRRLTNVQYDRTINDLLGISTLKASNNVQPSTILATDQSGGLTDLGWSSYQSVADMIATQVMADATLKKNFMACTPTGDGKACLHDTIVKFGRKAFRRPLTTDEIARFDKVVTDGPTITATGTVDEIATTLLYMFLISPSFIQRAEITETADGSGNYVLSSHEVAQRLSFMLWGSIPDDTLNTAADNNQLQTPAQILTQAQRMLTNDKARLKIAEFHRYYILMGPNTRWDTANKDTTLFPAFSTAIVPTLMAETEKFFDAIAFAKKGTFQDLMLSPVAFVNSATAPLYGLGTSGFTGDFKETMLDANQRPGFLTRVGFLNAYAFYNRTSPIHRGAFIMKQVLGTPIGTPPPGAEATALPPATADLNTNRKQVDAQTTGGVCESCHHGYINPAGFAMEAFDAVGSWQTAEKANGVAIDTTSDIVIDGMTMHVTGPLDLMMKLAASPMAQHRYAERLTSYMFEREGDPLDCGLANDLATKIAPGGYTLQNLITDLTQAPQFRTRAVGVM